MAADAWLHIPRGATSICTLTGAQSHTGAFGSGDLVALGPNSALTHRASLVLLTASEDTADFQQWSKEQNFSPEPEAYDSNAAQSLWLPSLAWMHLLRRGAVAEQGSTQRSL